MQDFEFELCDLSGVIVVNPFFVEDNRGYFLKNYEKKIFELNGIYMDIFQNFESYSHYGVVRGLHFQVENPQAKLVRCTQGKVWDVVVDVRKNSPTKGKWKGFELLAEENKSIYIPKGFAHGFISLAEETRVTYICSGKYSAGTDSGIVWDDSDLNIEWPIENKDKIILSERDKRLQSYKEFLIQTNGGLI